MSIASYVVSEPRRRPRLVAVLREDSVLFAWRFGPMLKKPPMSVRLIAGAVIVGGLG